MIGTTSIVEWIPLFLFVLLAGCGGDGNGAEDNGGDGVVIQEPQLMPDPTPVRYPRALWDENVEGETEVLVHVSAVGDVLEAYVAQTSGHAEFDSAAVQGARKLRFTPGKRGNKPVAMHVRIPVRFTRDSSATVGAPRSTGARN
jgi:TonB family protein